MYIYKKIIGLKDTDAAGVLFFSNQFLLFHEAFEYLLDSIGCDLGTILKNDDYLLPIVHAEADYTAPLTVGDKIEIQLSVGNVEESSFSISTQLVKSDQTLAGTVRTVHVSVDAKSGKKIPLPDTLRDKLLAIN